MNGLYSNGGLTRSWTQNSDFSSLGDASSLQNGHFKNQFEVENISSQKEKEIEVRILRRALNLPVGPFAGISSHGSSRLSNSTRSPSLLKNPSCPAKMWDVTDSGYSSKTPNQGTGSLNLLSAGTTLAPAQEELLQHVGMRAGSWSPTCSSYSSRGSCLPHSHTFIKSMKVSLEESENKRLQLLEKMKEAHLTIQNQSERLASVESERCYLRGQIKSMSIEHEGFQQQLESLETEKKARDAIRCESTRNRDVFLARINELDRQLKTLNHTHDALQLECKQKSAVLEQASLTLTFLEEENNTLQLGNEVLSKEISSMRETTDELVAKQQRQEGEKNHVYQELEKLKQVHQVLILQHEDKEKKLKKSWSLAEELKTKREMSGQEMAQLRLERDVAHGKLSVFEEEAQHAQESSAEVHRERDQLIRSNAEMEQRLQQLDFVNGLLRMESANVKEAFQKAEELNKLLKEEQEKSQRDKTSLKSETSGLKEKVRRIKESFEKEKTKRVRVDEEGANTESKPSHDQLVAYRDRLRAKCRELKNQVDVLKTEVKKLRKGKEEDKELLKLTVAQKDDLAEQQSSVSRKLDDENRELRQLLQSNNEVKQDLDGLKEQHQRILEKNSELKEGLSESENRHAQVKKEKEDLKKENEILVVEASKSKELEADKIHLQSQVEKLQSDHVTWALQKSELQMSHAELEAENQQLRAAVHDTTSPDAPWSEESADLKTELGKVQEMPRIKANKNTAENGHISSKIHFPRRKSDGSIDRLEVRPAAMNRVCQQLKRDLEHEQTKNSQLTNQVQEVLAERDSALSDIEDLRDGMQQLKEAFEEELESQRNAFCEERELMFQEQQEKVRDNRQQEKVRDNSQQLSDAYIKIERDLRKLSQEKLALETRNKNLECDRDELRGQIEELCKMRAGAVDSKAVQVDIIQSPKRKDSRITPLRKRSVSASAVPVITVEEMLDSPAESCRKKPIIPEEPSAS